MFGDAGHGILMFVAALWMVVLEKKFIQMKSDNEVSSHTHPVPGHCLYCDTLYPTSTHMGARVHPMV